MGRNDAGAAEKPRLLARSKDKVTVFPRDAQPQAIDVFVDDHVADHEDAKTGEAVERAEQIVSGETVADGKGRLQNDGGERCGVGSGLPIPAARGRPGADATADTPQNRLCLRNATGPQCLSSSSCVIYAFGNHALPRYTAQTRGPFRHRASAGADPIGAGMANRNLFAWLPSPGKSL